MKVGLSTSVIQRGKTGVAQYVFSLVRAFQKLEEDFQFRLFVLEEDRPFFAGLDERFELVSVSEKFRPPIKNIGWHQRVLPGLARELRLNVLHVPSYRRMLWPAPCPKVATIHDLAPFRVSGKYDLARMLYGRVVVKHLARRQQRIIAVSQNTARDIEQFFGISQARVRVIHNGLDHDRFYARAESEAREFVARKFDLRKPFLLYVARLEHPGKNHVRLIEAFEKLKEKTRSECLLVLGGSDWHGAEAIHQRIASSPYKEEIRSLGFVADGDLPALYSAARAFIYPSLYEGFGLPPLEAMACGCPVISSSRGSLGEVVADGAILVDPEDISSITDALVRFESDPHERATLAARGLARARQFSWENAAVQTLAVYRSLCGPSRVNLEGVRNFATT